MERYDRGFGPNGSATLAWTIDGKADPADCTARGTPYVHIVVRKDKDGTAGETRAACASFAFRFVLEPGTYTAQLTFENDDGSPASETVRVSEFAVSGRRDTWISINFATPRPPASQ
jgi:hypothetical protein